MGPRSTALMSEDNDGIARSLSPKAPPARLDGRAPLVFFRSPEKMRGAERRQALVRKRRTRWSVSRADRSPRTLRDHRRDTPTGAPLDALLRLSAEAFRLLPQLRSALACPVVRRAVSELLAQGS